MLPNRKLPSGFPNPVDIVSMTPTGTSIVIVAENRVLILSKDDDYALDMNDNPTACTWVDDHILCLGFMSGITLCVNSSGKFTVEFISLPIYMLCINCRAGVLRESFY